MGKAVAQKKFKNIPRTSAGPKKTPEQTAGNKKQTVEPELPDVVLKPPAAEPTAEKQVGPASLSEQEIVEVVANREPAHAPAETEEPITVRVNRKLLLLFIICALLGFAVVGGLLFYSSAIVARKNTAPTPAPSPESASPVPTASPAIAYDQYSVQVLNGSGTSGAAATVRDILKTKGFKKISVGNAKTFEHQETVLQFKKSVNALAGADLTALLGAYTVQIGEELAETANYDIVVTIGALRK